MVSNPASPVAAGGTGRDVGAGAEWAYAPAPESRDIVSIQREYGLFVDGDFVAPRSGEHFTTVNPASEETLARSRRRARKTWTWRSRRPAGVRAVLGQLPGRERAKYLYRIARAIQERAREFAVLESLDNGKPIKESRDVDVPLAAAHFFYHAGWADKLGLRRVRPAAAPARGGRPGHPVELPAADGGLEAGPGAGHRQHLRAQAGRDHPADRAAAGRGDRRGRPAARHRQHRHR